MRLRLRSRLRLGRDIRFGSYAACSFGAHGRAALGTNFCIFRKQASAVLTEHFYFLLS